MHFLDQAKIFIARQPAPRRGEPRREVHRYQGPTAAAGQGRRTRGVGRSRTHALIDFRYHAFKAPRSRAAPAATRPARAVAISPSGSRSAPRCSARTRRMSSPTSRGRPADRAAEGRRGRPRQCQLQDLHQSRAAPARHRLAGRGAVHGAAPQADRRRRAGRGPMPASRPSSTPSPTPRPRSATIRSRRFIPSSASSATASTSCSPTFPPDRGRGRGAGVGDRFLGHVERTRVLVHLVDANHEDVAAAWRTVRASSTPMAPGSGTSR